MSETERERWDRRYADGDYRPRTHPSPFLVDWIDRIPVGRALDVATGAGRNALHLAEVGFEVDALDISEVALARGREEADRRRLAIRWVVADLDEDPLPGDGYELVAVMRYRNRALWPRLADALGPDGWVVVEHHLRTERPDVAGPSNPAFRVEPRELLEAFGHLRVVHYSESVEPADDPTQQFALARLVACAGNPGW